MHRSTSSTWLTALLVCFALGWGFVGLLDIEIVATWQAVSRIDEPVQLHVGPTIESVVVTCSIGDTSDGTSGDTSDDTHGAVSRRITAGDTGHLPLPMRIEHASNTTHTTRCVWPVVTCTVTTDEPVAEPR